MEHYDVVVIGIGSMGSSTAYHLARRGVRVLGLEQFNILHQSGSYHGVNRVIRLAYSEDPRYVPLVRRAYELWRDVENLSGERLLFITGSIAAGTEAGSLVRGARRACEEHHLPCEELAAATLAKRFPGCRLPSDMMALYQPDGGFVLSERAVVVYVQLAQDLGAQIHGQEAVTSWELGEDGVRLHTTRASYTASRLVVTAGSWAPKLLPELARFAVPERQVLIWTQPLRPQHFRLGAFPVCNIDVPDGVFYAFPVYGNPGFKIGKYHHRREVVDPDRMDRHVYREDEEILRDGIRQYFPDANGPTLALSTCMFTNSPDEHFILDHHPSFPEVSIAVGFSGHGFKFASVVGEIMADLALEGKTGHDISLFKLDRFSGNLGVSKPTERK